MKTLNEIEDLKNKRVFLRVDLNVPIKEGVIKDDTRIRKIIPTTEFLMKKGAKLILASHLGRPKGERKKELSLAPCAKRLSELLNKEVLFTEHLYGEEVKKMIDNMNPGDVLLIENTRFEKGEEKNDEELAKKWKELADIYVNDAFSACHRKHASVYALPLLFKEKYAGFLLLEEVKNLSKLLRDYERPFITVLGGAKVKDKIGVIKSLIDKCDRILIGGGMAFTFLKALGKNIGDSILDESFIEDIKNLNFDKLLLPIDVKYADNVDSSSFEIGEEIPEGKKGLDIGPQTVEIFRKHIKEAKTIFWNGPMGVFENKVFSEGTYRIAEFIADMGKKGAFTVAGGGETVQVLKEKNLENEISFVSTGGGASLEFIEKGTLPGIEALT
jgi:3-phosphoglycerate kinase